LFVKEAIAVTWKATSIVWKLSVVAELAVAVRLLWQGLGGFYPALLTASLVFPIKSVLLMESIHFRAVWKVLVPIDWVFNAWIVFELFSWWTRSYPGIKRFGNVLLAVLLGASAGLSLLFWPSEWQALGFARELQTYAYFQRFAAGALLLFLCGTLFFFRNYPAPVPPNVVRASRIMICYLLGLTTFDLVWNFAHEPVKAYCNLGIVATTFTAFLAWATFLTAEGQISVQMKPPTTEEKDRIDRINEELLDFMRRKGLQTDRPLDAKRDTGSGSRKEKAPLG